ncbi:MAG: hypothetical protein ABIM50_05540 [Novosphingobium sp.]
MMHQANAILQRFNSDRVDRRNRAAGAQDFRQQVLLLGDEVDRLKRLDVVGTQREIGA